LFLAIQLAKYSNAIQFPLKERGTLEGFYKSFEYFAATMLRTLGEC